MDAFIEEWYDLTLNSMSTHISQTGTLVCPSKGDVERVVHQCEHFHLTEEEEIMQVEASANVKRLHNVTAIVINRPSRSEGSSARPRCI